MVYIASFKQAKIFLALLLILEVASVVLAFSFRSNANYYVHESMTKSIKKYNVVVDLTKAWNILQENVVNYFLKFCLAES